MPRAEDCEMWKLQERERNFNNNINQWIRFAYYYKKER